MALPVVQREGKMACWDLHNLELYEPSRGLQPFSCLPPVTTMASASPQRQNQYLPLQTCQCFKMQHFKPAFIKKTKKMAEKEKQPVPRGD